MIEADRADHSRAKLDHDLIVPITNLVCRSEPYKDGRCPDSCVVGARPCRQFSGRVRIGLGGVGRRGHLI